MKILGIDYGRRKIGLALSEGPFAEPLKVVHYDDTAVLLDKLQKVVQEHDVKKIVVGVSNGEMALESKKFAEIISRELGIGVEMYDETLSTKMAQKKAIEAGMGREKRKKMEDAFAAALILENYLENE